MKKFFYLMLVVALVVSCKNDGGSSNPADDSSGLNTLEINVDESTLKSRFLRKIAKLKIDYQGITNY